MSFEDDINKLNEYFFFKEFTYSKNKFKRPDGQEVEVADSIVYLDEISFVFQLKERDVTLKTSVKKEKKWFKKKVLKAATKQIRDTLSYISDFQDVTLSNNRGDSQNITTAALSTINKLVIHKSSEVLPKECQSTKYHISKTAGLIHIFQAHDYLGVVHYLVTPFELAAYLEFRSDLFNEHGEKVNLLSEPAILGQYLSGDNISAPSEEFTAYLSKLDRTTDSWDMTGIIKLFPDRMVGETGPTDYYYIVKEIAKLMRNELTIFKERFMLSWNAAKNNESVKPYRFLAPRTGCAFLFLPLLKNEAEGRREFLINLTLGNKYDLKAFKAIGVSFMASDGAWQDIEWCYNESPWVQDKVIDELLSKDSPFRAVKETNTDRYHFEGSS